MVFAAELRAALEAARLAAEVVREAYASFEPIADPRIDISTEADRAAQETILRFLHQTYPRDALCAEEATPTVAAGPACASRIWIVDPIDGTRGFATKNDQFSTMIALADADGLAVGAVIEPALHRLTYAVRGQGCWRQDAADAAPVRCRVTTVNSLREALLVQSNSKNPARPSVPVARLRPARVVETYSAGVKLARVARGEADLYVNTYAEFHDWDIAAGHILVEEAGGTVSGILGEKLHYRSAGAWQRYGLLATNGKLHAAAVAAMKEK